MLAFFHIELNLSLVNSLLFRCLIQPFSLQFWPNFIFYLHFAHSGFFSQLYHQSNIFASSSFLILLKPTLLASGPLFLLSSLNSSKINPIEHPKSLKRKREQKYLLQLQSQIELYMPEDVRDINCT